MSGKRGTSHRWSRTGAIDDSAVNQIYFALQGAVRVEQDPLPSLDGPATVLPRSKVAAAGGPLPHDQDVRAVLLRVLTTLNAERSKRPELRYVKLALRRHLELGLTLDQAFGYARVGKGAPPSDPDRARQIACAVFEERFIKGRNAETAGIEAGKKYGITKTPALDAFASHDGYALQFFRAQRMAKGREHLWSREEEQRLKRYYGPRQKKLTDWLDPQPE